MLTSAPASRLPLTRPEARLLHSPHQGRVFFSGIALVLLLTLPEFSGYLTSRSYNFPPESGFADRPPYAPSGQTHYRHTHTGVPGGYRFPQPEVSRAFWKAPASALPYPDNLRPDLCHSYPETQKSE